MPDLTGYRDLKIWQSAMELAERVYAATGHFPLGELHGLTAQLRQTAILIPAHIAEGYGLHTSPDYRRCLTLARGAVLRLETLLLLSHRLDHLKGEALDDLLSQTGSLARALHALLQSLPTP
ncbi:MAG: four helix bundle protein [Caldilineae bacterium]|nr:MAG: four helix bundle protein [Caldilineae bacterium]